MPTILITRARQLLTLHGPSGPRRGPALRELGIISDGALLAVNGVIVEVGPARRVENLAAARHAEVIDASGCVVMPGFVDSHTHLVHAQPRLLDYEMRIAGADYQQIAQSGGGILSSVRSLRSTPASRLEFEARKALAAFHRHGTTTIEAKSGYGLDETAEMKTLRVLRRLAKGGFDILPTYLGAHVTPPEFAGKPDEYIEWMSAQVMPAIGRRKLARFADVYCERGAFSVEQARRYLQAARRHGMLPKIHAQQFTSGGGVRLAVELEAVSADHLEHADEDDARLLARSPVMATLLPGAVFHLGLDTYPPARMLIDQGAAVALATDFNPGTSPTLSMPMVLSLACTRMRMTPAEAVSAATINGAHALRIADRAGSLEHGKEANLILLKAADYREIPYHFGVNLVSLTIRRGEIVYRE